MECRYFQESESTSVNESAGGQNKGGGCVIDNLQVPSSKVENGRDIGWD